MTGPKTFITFYHDERSSAFNIGAILVSILSGVAGLFLLGAGITFGIGRLICVSISG